MQYINNEKREELKKEFIKGFSEEGFYLVTDREYGVFATYWLNKAEELVAENSKAFGGCTKCYGKGYFTNLDAWSGSDEWTGEEYSKPTPYYNPCTCDRGKQFEQVWQGFNKVSCSC